jgi:hypothetical protein
MAKINGTPAMAMAIATLPVEADTQGYGSGNRATANLVYALQRSSGKENAIGSLRADLAKKDRRQQTNVQGSLTVFLGMNQHD